VTLIYADKGEWDKAIDFYQHSLEIKDRLGDIHGMARTLGNLGYLHRALGDMDQAAPYVAQAYFIFVQLGAAPEIQQAGQLLVNILGSVEAAITYLAQMIEASPATKDG
jgi:tetratricopeptide (TPR) repeat protein